MGSRLGLLFFGREDSFFSKTRGKSADQGPLFERLNTEGGTSAENVRGRYRFRRTSRKACAAGTASNGRVRKALFAASRFEGRSGELRIRIDPTGISVAKVGRYESLRGESVPDSNLRDGLFRGQRCSFWGDFSSAKSGEGALS